MSQCFIKDYSYNKTYTMACDYHIRVWACDYHIECGHVTTT